MMILNNLIAEDKAAELLASKWTENCEIQFVRSSSNYVYAFKVREETFFLRFNRVNERSREYLQSEIEFLLHLKKNQYPAAYPVISLNGNYIEEISYNGEVFCGSLFERAMGIHFNDENAELKHYRAWGKGLAQLHKLSENYSPKHYARPDYNEQLEHMKAVFEKYGEAGALVRLDKVSEFLLSIKENKENYGLIHYDFEDDNFVYDEEKDKVIVYDFDDAVYHFYSMDITASLNSLLGGRSIEERKECVSAFMEGYKEVKQVEEKFFELMPEFTAYQKLLQFSKLLRSMDCPVLVDNVPEWLPKLRKWLDSHMNGLRRFFEEG